MRVPTILRAGPYRVYFYSADFNEPAHVHVDRDRDTAKFWLDPLELAHNRRFSRVDLARIRRIVQQHQLTLLRAWNEYFS